MRRRKAGARLAEYNQYLESMNRPRGRRDYKQDYQTQSDSSTSTSDAARVEYARMPERNSSEDKRKAHRAFVRKFANYEPPTGARRPSMRRSSQDRMATPGSDATMSGSQNVNDSQAKQADFIATHSSLNRFMQQGYSDTSSIARNAMNRAEERSPVNLAALDQRIRDREAYSRAKADQMGLNIFGDMYKYKAPDYQQPDPEGPVETPDFDDLYDKYKDDVNDAD